MDSSLKLSVQWGLQTLKDFFELGINMPNGPSPLINFSTGKGKGKGQPLTIADICNQLELMVASMHFRMTGEEIQVQMLSIRSAKSPQSQISFGAMARDYFKSGERIQVEAQAATQQMAQSLQQYRSEEMLAQFRSSLRFALNDRILCNLGERWFPGAVVGTGICTDEDLFPYLVKTDSVPGAPSTTISVPSDEDAVCVQEVCFQLSELRFVKCAAPPVVNQKKSLRFAVGDRVVCRVRNGEDGLERWDPGTVTFLWPELPGERAWDMGNGMSGEYAAVVPYKVDLQRGNWIYCHKDHHTLIRREGMAPQTRARGVSKRMEIRTNEDGTRERIDHETERRKLLVDQSDDSDS